MDTKKRTARGYLTFAQDSADALKFFHAINRKAREIAKRHGGATAEGETVLRVNVGIAYGTDDLNRLNRDFHLKFPSASAAEEFTADFDREQTKVHMFERGVTFHIQAA